MTSTVIILAGRRPGADEPMSRDRDLSHKCLIQVGGKTLISRVLQVVEEGLPEASIIISVEEPRALAADSSVMRLRQSGKLSFSVARANLVDSLLAASEVSNFPLVVTTGDSGLLTPEALVEISRVGELSGADALVGLARKESIEAVHSGGRRFYYEFRDGAFSNCNLYWVRSRSSLRAAEAFRNGGQFIKVKGRALGAFGLMSLLLFLLKARTLDATFKAISKRFGPNIRPHIVDDGRLAIDVDDERSLRMTEELLAQDLELIAAAHRQAPTI